MCIEACVALKYAEKNDFAPDEQGLGVADLRILVEVLDILGKACQGDTWAILRGVGE